MDVARSEERNFRDLLGNLMRSAYTQGAGNPIVHRVDLRLVQYELVSAPSLQTRINDQSFIDLAWIGTLTRFNDNTPVECPFTTREVAAWLSIKIT